ncbi:hypothetical protein, partial [Mesorhizobium sp. M1A.F.Ca.IN.022.07.1.1]|uniref:hypothetical protein n=1 Tax=Mesorhizobium sp. M1A.F.Ca.IN.022.07.1.1 TaxID=2496767 RepID=UPI0019D04A57
CSSCSRRGALGKLVSSVQKDLVASLLTFIVCLVETKSDARAECCSAGLQIIVTGSTLTARCS